MLTYFDAMCAQTGYEAVCPEIWYKLTNAETIEGGLHSTYKELEERYANVEHYKEWTEIVMMLNWKLWEYYEKGHDGLAMLYNNLWSSADQKAITTFEDNDEACSYFYMTTD